MDQSVPEAAAHAVNALPPAAQLCVDAFAGAAYEVRELAPAHNLVKKFMKLHQQVVNSLPAGGKHWVKRRHYATIYEHLNNGHVGLGVFAGGKMVGQVLLTLPDLEGGKNLKGYPLGYGPGLLPPEQCMIVQTLGVHTGHRGKGIRTMLLKKAEEIAHRVYRRHLLAKTDIANLESVKGFEKAGYVASAETRVEGEKYACVFMYKALPPAPVQAMAVKPGIVQNLHNPAARV